MTLVERLAAAEAAAVRLYAQRQQVESQRQALAHQAQMVDQALVQSDGVIAVLQELIAAEKASA